MAQSMNCSAKEKESTLSVSTMFSGAPEGLAGVRKALRGNGVARELAETAATEVRAARFR
jgi:hypothetical protein